ncbi:OsmC family protein [Alicyclobacillus tolerans]|uniref:OsmC family protein n=1 Tax=Alicyclobacillus tolerans TaxID=90970 RepID=UPI001F15FB2E|nr:OsmC family protein [Alicyclobacillus tolerans]MCF8566121.1 OsmC family protein [Alicyclobacillus tolerans]
MKTFHRCVLNGSWSQGQVVGRIESRHISTDIGSGLRSTDESSQAATPEELLLAAASSCYLITLGTLLEHRNIPFSRIELESSAQLVQDPVLRLDAIQHSPTIVLNGTIQEDVLVSLTEHAEHTCMVSSALRGNVTVSVVPRFLVHTSEG